MAETDDGRYRTYRGNILQRIGLQGPTPELAGPPDMPVWMHPIEFSQVRAVLFALDPRHMVEWGSGGSSRAWLEALPGLRRLYSVEHHVEWGQRVRASIDDPRFTLDLQAPPEHAPEPEHRPGDARTAAAHRAWCMRCEDEPALMAHYVEAPRKAEVTFDVALVDGRARTRCLVEAFARVRPGGVVILHDAQRAEYHPTVEALGGGLYLEPWVQGQVCLLRVPG
ncbi:MAG: class I SAM-dependent methyltransferase [Myxococcales bacterium]|nr:class I SAM-dependent methyltransferase [Myxococcales bacterium]